MGSSHEAKKRVNAKVIKVLRWFKRGEDRSPRALVNEGVKHRGNGGKTKGIVRKIKRGGEAGRT